MPSEKRAQWLGVMLASACVVFLAGGCPLPFEDRPSEPVSTPPETGEEADPVEVARSLDNTPPTAHAGPDQTLTATRPVVLSGTGSSDPDRDRLTYEWRQVGGSPTVEFASNRYASIVELELPSDLGEEVTLTFRLVVKDGFAFDADEVRVTIRPAE